MLHQGWVTCQKKDVYIGKYNIVFRIHFPLKCYDLEKKGRNKLGNWLQLTQMCVDAASGMSYLSEKGCIHSISFPGIEL